MINLFYLASFVADVSLGIALLCVPVFAIKMFNVSALYLGFLGGLSAVIYTISVIITGRLVDKVNKKYILILGCFIFFVAYLVFPLVKNPIHILIIYPFGSVGMAMFWPSIQTWLAGSVQKKDLLKSISGFNVSWSIGVMCGSFLGGVLFEINPYLPFYTASILIFSVILLLINKPVIKISSDGKTGLPEKIDQFTSKKFIYIALMANFVSWSIVGTIRGIFPKLALFLNFSPLKLGFLMFTLGIAQSFMFFILGKTHRWHYKIGPLIFFQVLAALYLVAMSFVNMHMAFFVVFLFLGASSGMTYFSSIYYSLYDEENRGKRSGIHEAFLGTGALFGPLFSGFLAYFCGLRAPYPALAIIVLAVVCLEIWIIRRRV